MRDLEGDLEDDRTPLGGARRRSSDSRPAAAASGWKAGVVAVLGALYLLLVLVFLGAIASKSGSGPGKLSIETAHVTRMDVDAQTVAGEAGPAPEPAPEEEPFDAAVRGLLRQPGLFDLYTNGHEPDTHPGAGASSLLWAVPAERLGKPFLVTALYEHGDGTDALLHMPADETSYDVFFFRLSPGGRALDLVRPQLDLEGADEEEQRLVDRAAWTGWTKQLPVLAERGGGEAYLVDVSFLALVDGFYVTSLAAAAQTASSVRGENDLPRRVVSTAAYPRNLEVVVDFHAAQSGGDGPLTVSVHFSVAALPEEPMRRRVADDRVGFFNTVHRVIGQAAARAPRPAGRESEHVDSAVSYINRWRLEKTRPGDAVSPVVRPITFHVDPSVPEKWRPYIKGAVDMWKPAYEAAGFRDAIRAVLPGDPDWPADYSAGDIRYSTISWAIGLGSTYALGPSVVDPRTGEILNADIVFTNGWVRSYLRSFELKSPVTNVRAAAAAAADDDNDDSGAPAPGMLGVRARTPAGEVRLLDAVPGHARAAVPRLFHHRGHCQHQRGAAAAAPAPRLLALAHALRAPGARPADAGTPASSVPDEVIAEGLRDVAAHELGHCQGLRHNFKGSLSTPWDQLHNRTFTRLHGLTASVMDYLPVAITADDTDDNQGDYFSTTVGAYDRWAILYGYGEDEEPAAVASRSNGAELRFATDEDVPRSGGEDPYTNVFDLSADPLRWLEDRLALVALLRARLEERAVADGEPWTGLYDAHRSLVGTLSFAGAYAAKFVGGIEFSKAHRGDPAAPPSPAAPVARAEQERALALLARLLREDALFGTPALQHKLVRRTGWCSSVAQDCLGLGSTSPVDDALAVRAAVLRRATAAAALARLETQEWADPDGFTVARLLSGLGEAVMGADADGLAERVARRTSWGVQTEWVDVLGALAAGGRATVAAAAMAQLDSVAGLASQWINAPPNGTAPDVTQHVLRVHREAGAAMQRQ